jgi:protein tyrosine/serine phosphatase
MKIIITSLQLLGILSENRVLGQPQILEQNKKTVNITKQYNFHIVPDGKNNYRSAQLPINVFEKVIEKYDIKTIIRLNGDGGDSKHTSSDPGTSIDSEKKLAEKMGVTFYQIYAKGDKNQQKVNDLLSQGNVLIHCAHGADRTGGNVGGYLYNVLGWDTKKIWEYTTKYNGWNRMVLNDPKSFVSGGYLDQAKKFGITSLDHAKELANGGNVNFKKKVNKTGNLQNIIIGDSQVPFIDMNTNKANRISTNPGQSSLWEGGKTVSWLISALENYNVDSNVANVILCIGTNGGFGKFANDNVNELFSQLNKKFPKSKIYVVQGSWGWGGLKNIKEKDVRDYYEQYKKLGGILIEPPIGNIEPHGNKPIYKEIGSKIDSLID